VHGPDFRLAWSSGYDLGWKAAAVNLADIAAMGRPTALFVRARSPMPHRCRSWRTSRAASGGVRRAHPAAASRATSSDVLTIAVTAIGVHEVPSPCCGQGARPGDVVAVAG
jgi:thiamine-monophosphate kinase